MSELLCGVQQVEPGQAHLNGGESSNRNSFRERRWLRSVGEEVELKTLKISGQLEK